MSDAFCLQHLRSVPKPLQKHPHTRLRNIFDTLDTATARKLLEGVVQEFEAVAPKAKERAWDWFRRCHGGNSVTVRRRLRTTNGIKRLNREIYRRERMIGIFPNEEAALRLIDAVLMGIDKAWTTDHRYLDMTEYWIWRQEPEQAGALMLMAIGPLTFRQRW